MSFAEAWKEMVAGKKVRRPNFKGYWYINPENGLMTINLGDDKKEITYGNLNITAKNCAANDWVVVE